MEEKKLDDLCGIVATDITQLLLFKILPVSLFSHRFILFWFPPWGLPFYSNFPINISYENCFCFSSWELNKQHVFLISPLFLN